MKQENNDINTFFSNSTISITSILEMTNEAVMILDKNLNISAIHQKTKELFLKLYGQVDFEDSKSIFSILPPSQKLLKKELVLECLSGEPFEYDLQVSAYDRSLVQINCGFIPLKEEEQIIGIYIRFSEESYQTSRKPAKPGYDVNLFELFMEHAPLRAWITDKRGKMHYMNSNYKKAFGIPAEVDSKLLSDLFPNHWAQTYLADIHNVLKTNETSIVIGKGKRSTGVDGVFKFTRFPLRVHGETMVAGWAVDITEQEELQEKLLETEQNKKRDVIRSIIETQEKERRQLSIELHDNVNQILSSCKLMLETAKENKEAASQLIDKCYLNLITAINEIRNISHELNPSAIEDIGLTDAITDLIENINSLGKIFIEYHCQGCREAHLDVTDKVAIYRIVQEGLNNILKHARASKVSIHLYFKEQTVYLKIEDDGIGFDLKNIHRGIGLKNIEHRIAYYQGTLSIESSPGNGCSLTIQLTLPTVGAQ